MVSMRVLVTGHRGNLGEPLAEHLAGLGHDVAGFDVADGDDLLDLGQVQRAAAGCAAVVHLGALAHDSAGPPERIMAVNVLGTWHALLAAERAEDLCAGFTARTAIPTVSLRPVWVWRPDQYGKCETQWRSHPAAEWEPFWEFGAFVDVRDVAAAVELALTAPLTGHHRAVLCAADIAATKPSLAMAAQLTPDVPVRDRARYQASPWRALVDCSVAADVLGWHPTFTWSGRGRA
jgi:UDP-glucose 4-epimerase